MLSWLGCHSKTATTAFAASAVVLLFRRSRRCNVSGAASARSCLLVLETRHSAAAGHGPFAVMNYGVTTERVQS
jgi:hypothetical protein